MQVQQFKRSRRIGLALLVGAILGLGGCGRNSSLGLLPGAAPGTPATATFSVRDRAGLPVAGATVYLVPADDVDGAPIDGQAVLDGSAENRDEPLEDAVRQNGASYPQAVTDAAGHATIATFPAGRYFWFVMPAAGDLERLPGGSGCRVSIESTAIEASPPAITLSGRPGASAQYVGSTACLVCHPGFATHAQHAHRLGFAVPGQFTAQQDDTRYPDYRDNWNLYLPAAAFGGGTPVYFSDFDAGRGFDKFKTSRTDPSGLGQTVYVRAWLWRDTTDGNKFKITLENLINPGDPMTPWTLEVPLTYGGAVYKQRNLVRVPGRKGLYPLLQYQTEGDETRFDRTRKEFRDYHLDWFWDANTQQFKLPPVDKTFEGNCTACHSTGFVRFQDGMTGEWLSDAVNDANGAFDIDGDSMLDEINLGCEVCHGPGSQHGTWAGNPANAGMEARYIVSPDLLSPSREMMICGRCHDRPRGNGPLVNDEPLNAAGEMAPVGISRQDFLASYVSRKGPALSDYWSDGLHSKSHHQQYTDLLKSKKHRNNRVLTTCSDCHSGHGDAPFENHLKGDPDDATSTLCRNCHIIEDLIGHMVQTTGAVHLGNGMDCVDCHVYKPAKTGAGTYGFLIAAPTGTAVDVDRVFYENDISSHLFGSVPSKFHPDVGGNTPSFTMPIPYTKSCGQPCHSAATIPFLKPQPVFGPAAGLRALEEAHK